MNLRTGTVRLVAAGFAWLGITACAFTPLMVLAQATPPSVQPAGAIGDQGDGRIVGGTDASLGDAPYQVEIAYAEDKQPPEWAYTNVQHPWKKTAADDHHCGGALIAADWVLTAQHCVRDGIGPTLQASDLVVRGGDVSITVGTSRSLNPRMRVFAIRPDGLILYPGYRPSSDFSPPENDLALVHLQKPVPLDPPTRSRKRFATILLASRPYMAGPVFVSGWGSVKAAVGLGQVQREQALNRLLTDENTQAIVSATEFTAAMLPMSPHLQIATLAVVDNATCANRVQAQIDLTRQAAARQNIAVVAAPPVSIIPAGDLCADGGNSQPSAVHKATCQGDSGGPLVAPRWAGSQRALVAVVGWAVGCAQAPGVYTRITPDVVKWVSAQTNIPVWKLTGATPP